MHLLLQRLTEVSSVGLLVGGRAVEGAGPGAVVALVLALLHCQAPLLVVPVLWRRLPRHVDAAFGGGRGEGVDTGRELHRVPRGCEFGWRVWSIWDLGVGGGAGRGHGSGRGAGLGGGGGQAGQRRHGGHRLLKMLSKRQV